MQAVLCSGGGMFDAADLVGLFAHWSCCQKYYDILRIWGSLGLKQAFLRTGASQTNFSLTFVGGSNARRLVVTHFASGALCPG
jgi:hypothetical protein